MASPALSTTFLPSKTRFNSRSIVPYFSPPSPPSASSRRSSSFTTPRCQKMYVPEFGEASRETNAATNLHDFFTYLAVTIVLAQLESYNPEAHEEIL